VGAIAVVVALVVVALREKAEISALLAHPGVRLVTLTGTGGVGKTRLALEVARDQASLYRDGPVFVPLAPVADPTLVPPTLARAVGLVEAHGQSVLDALRLYLRDKDILLVLDNFEHVIEVGQGLAELLASCPRLWLLVTSRAPLRLRGEQEYHVGPLGVPELRRVPTPEDVIGFDAVKLFVERARQVSPAFELTEANATAVTAICRRLDGLPLALELAAARVRTLSPTELLGRLDQSLPLPPCLPAGRETSQSGSAQCEGPSSGAINC
jgi:predicted ATPase